MLVTEDEAGMDEKIICVPISKIDPTYENITNLNDLPEHILKKIEFFFENYKKMESEKWVKIHGFRDADLAIQTIKDSKLNL